MSHFPFPRLDGVVAARGLACQAVWAGVSPWRLQDGRERCRLWAWVQGSVAGTPAIGRQSTGTHQAHAHADVQRAGLGQGVEGQQVGQLHLLQGRQAGGGGERWCWRS